MNTIWSIGLLYIKSLFGCERQFIDLLSGLRFAECTGLLLFAYGYKDVIYLFTLIIYNSRLLRLFQVASPIILNRLLAIINTFLYSIIANWVTALFILLVLTSDYFILDTLNHRSFVNKSNLIYLVLNFLE